MGPVCFLRNRFPVLVVPPDLPVMHLARFFGNDSQVPGILAVFSLEGFPDFHSSNASCNSSVRRMSTSILMTAFGTAAGMLPIAMERAIGLERLSALAVVAIGGLMVSTFLTLLYVPIFYTIFEDITGWLYRAAGRLSGQESERPVVAGPVNGRGRGSDPR